MVSSGILEEYKPWDSWVRHEKKNEANRLKLEENKCQKKYICVIKNGIIVYKWWGFREFSHQLTNNKMVNCF